MNVKLSILLSLDGVDFLFCILYKQFSKFLNIEHEIGVFLVVLRELFFDDFFEAIKLIG